MPERDEPPILEEMRGAVALVTLNRPRRSNAWTLEMTRLLPRIIRRCDEDDAVRAIVVTGAGEAFCAGMDVAEGGFERRTDADGRLFDPRSWTLRTPIIAAIQGTAVGVGITLPLHFDIRIAAEDAKLGFIFVRRGFVPEANSTWLLARLIGQSRATELVLTGRFFSGREAEAIGLVSEALPREKVLPRALELGEEIAAHTAPAAVALTKQLMWSNLAQPDPEVAYEREHRASLWCFRSPDVREAVEAFREKRPPRWKLRPSRDLPGAENPAASPRGGPGEGGKR